MSQEKLEQAKRKWKEKLAHYEYELSITASAENKFELRERIQECQQEIERITKKIESLNRNSQSKNNPADNKSPELISFQTEINVHSEKKVDYTNLDNLLAKGKWKEANEETFNLIIKLTSKEVANCLRVEDINQLPCQDLYTIDQLWQQYSNGKFGFAIQNQIYQPLITDTKTQERWQVFGERVGWGRANWLGFDWKPYLNLTFASDAPLGHLPVAPPSIIVHPNGTLIALWTAGHKIFSMALWKRLADCSSNNYQFKKRKTQETESFEKSRYCDSINESKTKYTLNTKDNFKQMEFRDRQEILGSVVFFFIPQLAEQEPNISNNALILLNEILKERLLDRGLELRILSSIKGAIAVIPDSSTMYIHQHLSVILEDCKNQGIPVRMGITHGELEVLKDADTLFSFIGIPMNVAARLSTSDNNKGILYDSTYIKHVMPLPTSQNNDSLHPRYCKEVDISGKPHDPIFKCREPDDANLVLSQFNNDILSQLNIESDYINGIAIAYDLPKFSRGDRSELSKRFRSVIDSINSIRTRSIFPEETNQFFFSPGGDGGILILPIKLDISLSEYINLAFELIEKLQVESDSKDSNIDVKSRVGVHSGIIILYQNAEGISRPTGLTCFIADEIASDDLAKQKGGIIITENIKGSLYSGSIKCFEKEYESLTPLNKRAAKDIQRYAKK